MSLEVALLAVQGHVVPWFDPARFAGLVGGLGGAMLGILGGTIGALCSSSHPPHVRAAITTADVTWAAGGCFLGAGLVAEWAGQPSGVAEPLINFGAITLAVFLAVRRVLMRRHAELTQNGEQPPTPA